MVQTDHAYRRTIEMKNYLFIAFLLIGCTAPPEKSTFQNLLDYEGHYEYVGSATLDIMASELDTTIYAVIDHAKYPLTYLAVDSFADAQGDFVIFQRNGDGEVIGYETADQVFKLLTREFERMEMLPRRELLDNPEGYTYESPMDRSDGLATGSLFEEFDDPSSIIEMIRQTIAGEYRDVHSILIYKNDKLVLEEYFYGFTEADPHQLRSATKPIIGGVLGLAVDRGLVGSETDRLLPYFSSRYDSIENMDSRKEAITIEDFLRYRHGMDCENNNSESAGSESRMMESKDWIKYTLDLPMVQEPGLASSYCTGCALTIGSLVEIVSQKNIEDFANEHLFTPLGITNYKWVFEPNQASFSNFSQLSVRPRDLVKLAVMYKDGGEWQGKQIMSERWVDKTFDMEPGDYGYGWQSRYFEVEGKRYSSYLATGNGGQKINIWPELDMITVFTGGNYNSYFLYGKSTPPNEMIPKYILSAISE